MRGTESSDRPLHQAVRSRLPCRRSDRQKGELVDWNAITLYILGAFGVISLAATLLTSLVRQLPELVDAVRTALSSLRGPGGQDGDDS